jgi:transposase-like protein
MQEALEAILGNNAAGLSSTNVTRLAQGWQEEHAQWKKRDLSGKEYVYWRADGIYCNVRLEKECCCLLVIIGADRAGNKELLAVVDGQRESKISWSEVLLDLKKRGLTQGPQLAIGDGSLGFWNALEKVYSKSQQQRCWVHKTKVILIFSVSPRDSNNQSRARLAIAWLITPWLGMSLAGSQ